MKGPSFRLPAVKCFSFKKADKATAFMVVMAIHWLWLMVVHKKMRVSKSPCTAQVGLELVMVLLPLPPEC